MEAKKSFSMVLLIIITALAITLCGLTAYILFFNHGSSKEVEKEVHTVARPADEEISVKKLFDKKLMNLKSTDPNKIPVIQTSAEIVYLKKVTGVKNVEEKIKHYEGEIKELIGTYFQNITLEEVKKQDAKEIAKKEITLKINELLCLSEKEKKSIVYTINFEEWFYQ